MSSAEPFMPAHEPAAPVPPQEHDIDHDVDVILEVADESDEQAAGSEPWHTDATAPTLPRPVPGAHLTAEQLAADLEPGEPE